MRFMVIVKADKESEAGVLPSREILEKMGAYNEQLVKAGVMLAGGGVEIELRQIFEAEDFGDQLTPELREQEARIAAQARQLSQAAKS